MCVCLYSSGQKKFTYRIRTTCAVLSVRSNIYAESALNVRMNCAACTRAIDYVVVNVLRYTHILRTYLELDTAHS